MTGLVVTPVRVAPLAMDELAMTQPAASKDLTAAVGYLGLSHLGQYKCKAALESTPPGCLEAVPHRISAHSLPRQGVLHFRFGPSETPCVEFGLPVNSQSRLWYR